MAEQIEPRSVDVSHVQWLTDLVRLEIVLWERIDARLREEHDLPLAFFEPLYVISRSPRADLRVGDLARALRITVGGCSKLVDRIEAAGLIRREPDPGDRRASRLTLTPAGSDMLAAAGQTYEKELARALDGALTRSEQRQMHQLVVRLFHANSEGEPS